MAIEAWMYRDPEQVAMQMQAKRVRLRKEANGCAFKRDSPFYLDKYRCVARKQGFERCEFCDLKRK